MSREPQPMVAVDVTPSGTTTVDPPPPKPWLIVGAVAAIIVVLVVAGSLLDTRDPHTAPAVPTSPSTTIANDVGTELPPPSSGAATPGFPVLSHSGDIEWQLVAAGTPITTERISTVAATATAFLVLADPRYPSSLWLSDDGMEWEAVEPAAFDGGTATAAVATSREFFLKVRDAAGRPALYRSADGRRWQLVDDDASYDLLGAGSERILARDGDRVLTSVDGSEWVAIDTPPGFVVDTKPVLQLDPATQDRLLINGTINGGAPTMLSVIDGVGGPEIPGKRGSRVATNAGIAAVSNEFAGDCSQSLQLAIDATSEGFLDDDEFDPDLVRDVYRGCRRQARTTEFHVDEGAWIASGWDAVLSDSPMDPTVARVADTVVAVLTTSNLAVAVWTSPADDIEWSLSLSDLPGSQVGLPRAPLIAATSDRVLIIPQHYQYENRTPIVVGVVGET